MTIQIMNPPGLAVAQTHSQLAVASGSRTIYLAGQIGQDAQGRLVGVGDLAAQTEQALTNVGIALQAAGAGWADIAKMTIYVAGWKPERMGALRMTGSLPSCLSAMVSGATSSSSRR